MNCDLFKSDINVFDDCYTYEFVDYLISKIILSCDNKKCSINYIIDEINGFYHNKIKTSRLKSYIKDNYETDGCNNYIISDSEQVIISLILFLEKGIADLKDKSESELYSMLCKLINDNDYKLSDLYLYFMSLEIINNPELNIQVILSKMYNLLCKKLIYKEEYEDIYNTILSINTAYDDLPIDYIIVDKICINFLSINNISNIKKIKGYNRNITDLILIFDNSFFKFCLLFSKPLIDSLFEIKLEYKKSIEDKEDQIIKMRFGYETSSKTLEEVGKMYSVTRERVRQIESKAMKKIEKIAINNKILLNLFFEKMNKKNKMIPLSFIDNYIEDSELSFLVGLLLRDKNVEKCSFDSNYNCLYNSNFVFDDVVKYYIKDIPIYISDDMVDELNYIQKLVFEREYKKYHNIYIRKNMIPRDLYISVIKKSFPSGYKATSDEDYNKLKEIIKSEVGEINDFPSSRSLSAMIERDESMIQCDRGTFIDINNTTDVPEELYQRIIDYIYDNKPVVYYNSLFDVFKNELALYGIFNQYLLKGIVDKRLPEDFFSKRDYISVGSSDVCPRDSLLSIIHSYNSIFSIDDLRNKFPGVGDYVFYNVLYPEKNKGLIFLDNKRFVYYNNLNIDNSDVVKIKNIIDEMFVNLKTDLISARKLYARIQLLGERYCLNLGMINHYFDLYSIVQYLFPEEYYYSRPYISTNPEMTTSRTELVRKHMLKYDEFTSEDARKYLNTMNVGGIYSFLAFIENMSDNFVQVEMDKMVKKELLGLDDNLIRSIRKTIDLLLSNFEKIDTRVFSGYSMFPRIKYDWNKYLLVGIVRSYLSDYYVIDYTDNKYTKTDYIIRRDSNE